MICMVRQSVTRCDLGSVDFLYDLVNPPLIYLAQVRAEQYLMDARWDDIQAVPDIFRECPYDTPVQDA